MTRPADADLEAVATRACREATRLGVPQVLALRAPVAAGDGLALLEASRDEEGFLFERPTEGRLCAGLGVLPVFQTVQACDGLKKHSAGAFGRPFFCRLAARHPLKDKRGI